MAPFYREEEYHDFMSSLMTISANDGSPTLSATDPVNVSRQANFVALRNTTRGAEMQELLVRLAIKYFSTIIVLTSICRY